MLHCARPQPATPVVSPTPAPTTPSQQASANTHETQQGHDPHGQPAHPAQPGQQAPQAGATRRFGEALAADATRVSLSTVLHQAEQHRNKNLRIEGQIVAVCQHMGCWMELRDEQTQAHVRMHGHSFFLPRDVNGKRAALVGTLVAAHPPTECDESARQAAGQQAAVELDATGIEVYD